MKNVFKVILSSMIILAVIASCVSPPPPADENPNKGPELSVKIPELFGPDPDDSKSAISILINVKHPVGIKDWNIIIQPIRQNTGQGQGQTQPAAQTQAPRQRTTEDGQRQRQPFFQQNGNGTPPAEWKWNGRSSRNTGEMVQSATDYRFQLTVNDVYNNSSVYEGTIGIDVIVRKEGNNLRIVVPSIIFPGDSADLSRVSEEDQRSNRRVLRLIAASLNKYPDYRITIEGHANPLSAQGTPAWTTQENIYKPLSEQRARAVGEYLASNHSIAITRFTYAGFGTTKPVADYTDEEEQWKNRRVEFLLIKN